MRVHVDEARREREAVEIDDARRLPRVEPADGVDAAAGDRDVGGSRRGPPLPSMTVPPRSRRSQVGMLGPSGVGDSGWRGFDGRDGALAAGRLPPAATARVSDRREFCIRRCRGRAWHAPRRAAAAGRPAGSSPATPQAGALLLNSGDAGPAASAHPLAGKLRARRRRAGMAPRSRHPTQGASNESVVRLSAVRRALRTARHRARVAGRGREPRPVRQRAGAEDAEVRSRGRPAQPRSDLDDRLHHPQPRLHGLRRAVRRRREVPAAAADGRQVRAVGGQAHLHVHAARRPQVPRRSAGEERPTASPRSSAGPSATCSGRSSPT